MSSSTKIPLKVTYIGHRAPVFPTETNFLKSSAYNQKWVFAYVISLISVYITLKIWWSIWPSYSVMFYLWMVMVPLGVAYWAAEKRQGCLAVGLMSGVVAWGCDFFLLAIMESD